MSKYFRFELEPENIENWNLPTQLASYICISTHISEKDIRAISSSYCEKDSKIG